MAKIISLRLPRLLGLLRLRRLRRLLRLLRLRRLLRLLKLRRLLRPLRLGQMVAIFQWPSEEEAEAGSRNEEIEEEKGGLWTGLRPYI